MNVRTAPAKGRTEVKAAAHTYGARYSKSAKSATMLRIFANFPQIRCGINPYMHHTFLNRNIEFHM